VSTRSSTTRAAEFAELIERKAARDTIDRNLHFSELFRLQGELVKLQDGW